MKRYNRKSAVRETIEAVIIALLIAIVIRTFVIQAFKIPSGSMIPTLQIGDHLLVNKFLLGTPVDIPFTDIHLFNMPGLRKPRRSDVIVFKYPEDPRKDFIKRVIALREIQSSQGTRQSLSTGANWLNLMCVMLTAI